MLSGCTSTVTQLLLPDQLVILYGEDRIDSSGNVTSAGDPWTISSQSSGTSKGFRYGLIWDITDLWVNDDRQELIRAITRAAMIAAREAAAEASKPAPPISVQIETVTLQAPPEPPIDEPERLPATADPPPEQVEPAAELEDDPLEPFILPLIGLITAIAGYVGRKRIPYLRDVIQQREKARQPKEADEPGGVGL